MDEDELACVEQSRPARCKLRKTSFFLRFFAGCQGSVARLSRHTPCCAFNVLMALARVWLIARDTCNLQSSCGTASLGRNEEAREWVSNYC